MIRKSTNYVVFAAMTSIFLAGCMPKMTIEEIKAMMPERPAELDKLNAFAGKWTFSGEAKMAVLDEVLPTSGTMESKWEGDGWFLVGTGKFNMGDIGNMEGRETWTYDAHSKKYRSTWVDSMGSTGIGESWIDDKTNTWYMKATSYGFMGKSYMKGWVRIIDDNTQEWEWSEYAMGGLIKTMEMKGTSKRQ